ncbi:DNA primase domain protein [Pseudomonas chlororaphis subsp. piscium]|nr:DNA primase domain protein [Pseudomonas chlororaphis subsp. piscium]
MSLSVPAHVLATSAANEALPWNAEAWLSAFDQALDAEDGDQQDALALLAKQAMEDAQQRGDIDREQSIRAAASKARQAREDAAEEAQARQPTVPNIEVPFGTGAITLPSTPVEAQQQVTTTEASNTLATKPKRGIDSESREILKYISEDFVMYASGSKLMAYHITSGDEIGKEGFKQYCAKHYGGVLIIAQDKDGNPIEKRAPAGDIWWEWDEPDRRVVRRIVMEPTSKTAFQDAEENPEVFNRWHVLKGTMIEPDGHSTRDDIKIFEDHLLFLSDNDQPGVTHFLCWLAWMYQFPEKKKQPVAPYLSSPLGGVGKSMIFPLLSTVFGPPLCAELSGKDLIKSQGFTSRLEGRRLIWVNEVERDRNGDVSGTLKDWIDGTTVNFESKGRNSQTHKNIMHFVLTGNKKDAIELMENDRRYSVLRCTSKPKDRAYYSTFLEWRDGPGPAALANALKHWVFPDDWDAYGPAPQSAAARELQQQSVDPMVEVLSPLMDKRLPPFDRDIGRYASMARAIVVVCDGIVPGRLTPNRFANVMESLGAVRIGNPNATAARYKAWCWRRGRYWSSKGPIEWDQYIDHGTIPDDRPKAEVSDHE